MAKNDSRESRAAEAERRRKIEGNTLFENLGEPIQRLLRQISKDVSDKELEQFSRISVRQLAKVFDMLALEEDPDKILAWLRREMDKSNPDKKKEKDPAVHTVRTGAARDAIAFYKELEKKNIELMEKMKESARERDEKRSSNIAERKKRREEAMAEAAAARERGEKIGETKKATEKLTRVELADIVGTFDRFSSKQSTYDNSNANQDTEWWKTEEFRRDFEKNGKKGKMWSRVIQGGTAAATESELAAREEWFRSQCWWKSDKFRRDWLASRDAEWWKEETYIRDWQDNGANGAMWVAADELSGFNRKGDRRKASEAELARRVEWYKNNGPKGIVKNWCALAPGSADRCTLEEKREREDFFKNGDWWRNAEVSLQHAGGKTPSLGDPIFVAGAAGQDREWWKSEEYRQDFVKGGAKWKALSEKAAATGADLAASQAEAKKREEWFVDNWWKAEKYVQDYKKNGPNGKLWRAASEAETAQGDKAKLVKETDARLRENWFATRDDREWWKSEEYLRDWQENGKTGKRWQAGWQDAGEEATGDVDKAKAEEIARREEWYNQNWWKAEKYVKDFIANGAKGTSWKCATKETHADSDWWKEGEYIKQWSAAKTNDVTPFWQSPAYVEDYWKSGAEGKKWVAANAAAGSVAKGDQFQATPEDLAEREAFYQANWWRSPECQRDFDANGRNGSKWLAGNAQGQGRATPQEIKEREAFFNSKFTPAYNAMFEADATKHTIPNPAPFEQVAAREEYYKKNWWKRPEVKEDYLKNGEHAKLFKAATSEVAAMGLSEDPAFQASPAEIAARKQWFDSGAAETEWWQESAYHKEAAAAKEPEFWKNTEAIDDYVKNGNKGTVWNAANAAVASVGRGAESKATPEELKDREDWLKKNFWKSSKAREDFAKNGEKGTIWSSSEPNGKGQTVADTDLKSRMAFFRPTHGFEAAERPAEVGGTAAGAKVADCGLGEAQDREQWFEKNWWKSPEVEEDYRKHGVNGKLFKAATHEVAALGVSDQPEFQASPELLQERIQYFETCDDRDWWKDPAVVADFQKNGREGAAWQSRSSKEAAMSMGIENPATSEELAEREQWFQKNFWKSPAALEDFAKNGKNGALWKAASLADPANPASPAELQIREQWFESHKTADPAEVEARKEWFQSQLTDEEKIARRDWVVKQNVECKKISTDELSDVLASLNDGQAPTQEQLAAIEDAVKRRRAELFGDDHGADPDAITQEEFVTAVAETNFYVPQTDEERLRAEEEALEAMQAEEMMRLQEEAEFLKLEAEEERAAAGEDYVDEGAAADEEAAFLNEMEANNALETQPNEDDVQYTEEDEAAWQDYLQNQSEQGELSEEQAAELQRQEEDRLAAEAAREAAEAEAWQSEEFDGEEEYEHGGEEAGLLEDNKEELEALVQEDGEGWGEEGEEAWEEAAEEPVVEEIDELAKEEKGQPHQWKLPLRQVTNPQYLKSYFTVIKYTPSHSLLGGKSKRVWVVDHFTRCFYNLENSGKIKKEHAANKLLQLERNILDSCRLRLMFFDASHSYELQFQSPEERERFYETASAIRPSIRVYAPDLTNTDTSVEACTTTIDGIGPEAVTVTCNNATGKPVQRELTGECKVNASKLLTEPLTIWTGTFNMSGHPPPRNKEELAQWMPRDKYDIYAVAVQEASYRKEESEWFEFVQAYLGKDYLSLASMNLWDTLLIVLCRKKHLLKITNVEGSTKATVHKSVCGTKGGIGISLRYLETSICFVTCHLAARLERNAMRNTNLEEIFDCLQLGIRETDFCNQFNHVFFFGDFNYRVELDAPVAEKIIADKNHQQLLDYDQLSLQRQQEGICHGWQEPPITFAPTYRMQVGTDKYMSERGNAPSYCDRVLTRSMGNTWVKCTSYKSAPQVKTSEHQPVSASFIIRCVRPVMSCFAQQQSPVPMFVFKEVSFSESTGPIIKKPALMIQTPFSKINKHVEAKTTGTATPHWDGSALQPIVAVTQVQEYLETCHMVLIIREAAEKREDKMHRGTACVTLFGRVMGVEGVEQEFESDVLCHGKCIGKLVGKFHWEAAPQTHGSNT